MSTKVDNSIKAKLTIGGIEYDASLIQLVFEEGQIPYYTAVIAPFSQPVVKPTLASFLEGAIPNALEQAAQTSQKCNLTVKMSDSGVDINLNGWLIKQVGVAVKNALSVEGIPVNIYHPAVQLTQIYFGTFGLAKMDTTTKVVGSTGFKDAVTESLTIYGEALELTDVYPSFRPSLSKVRKDLKTGIKLINKYIKCDVQGPNKMPTIQASQNWILSYALTASGQSLWDWLVSLAYEYYLQVVPDPNNMNGPLILQPKEPWGDVKVTVKDTTVGSIDVPSLDVKSVSGVGVVKSSALNAGIGASYIFEQKQQKYSLASKIYVYPKQPAETETARYRYVQQGLAPWLERALLSGHNAEVATDVFNALEEGASTGDYIRAFASAQYIDNTDVIEDWVKEAFYMTCCSNIYASFVCHPSAVLQSGNIVMPGMVVSVSSLFKFFSSKTTHIFNAAQRSIYSTIEGNYYRNNKVAEIDEPHKIKFYE